MTASSSLPKPRSRHGRRPGRRGTSVIPYGLLIAMIALGTLVALNQAGNGARDLLAAIAGKLGGASNTVEAITLGGFGEAPAPEAGDDNTATSGLFSGPVMVATYDRINNAAAADGSDANSGSWPYTSGDAIRDTTTDADGYTYAATSGGVHKIDPNGNLVWKFTGHSGTVRSVAVGADGSVYSAGNDATVRKLDADGNEAWSFAGHSDRVWDVATDADGNAYSVSNDNTVRKIDADGNEVWTDSEHTGNVYAVSVDPDGNVYTGSQDNTVRKLDADGQEVWSFAMDNGVYDVVAHPDGSVYATGNDDTVRKITADGQEAWRVNGSNYGYRLSLDADDNLYAGFTGGEVKQIDPDGNEIWSQNYGSLPRGLPIRPE